MTQCQLKQILSGAAEYSLQNITVFDLGFVKVQQTVYTVSLVFFCAPMAMTAQVTHL